MKGVLISSSKLKVRRRKKLRTVGTKTDLNVRTIKVKCKKCDACSASLTTLLLL